MQNIIIDYEDSGKSNLQASFFYSLIEHLKVITEQKQSKLTDITLLNAKYLKGKFDKSFVKYAAFITDYNAIGWRFDIKNEGKQLLIYRFL